MTYLEKRLKEIQARVQTLDSNRAYCLIRLENILRELRHLRKGTTDTDDQHKLSREISNLTQQFNKNTEEAKYVSALIENLKQEIGDQND